jgi:dihydroorotate dehydrogenase electron transfer subunit
LTNQLVADHRVIGTDRIGDYAVLSLRAEQVAALASPGQFVNVALAPGAASILRRPFSIYRAEGDTISIAFDAIGAGTRWLAARAPGDTVNMIGPLGTGFPLEPGPALLVGGGYGTAALAFLARALVARGTEVHAIVGARSAGRLFVDDTLREACASVEIVTDDGSAGARGIVTDPMPAAIQGRSIVTVYACGPNRMLEAAGNVAAAHGVPSRLAVEEFMACGVGVCWTCVFPVRVDGTIKHLRSCTEGPVFEGAAIAWA